MTGSNHIGVLFMVCLLFVGAGSASAAIHRVVDYGARCDAVTNDTAAIQNALNAAQAGDSVEFPAGWCVYSGNLFIDNKSSVEVYGAGMHNTFLRSVNQYASSVVIRNSGWITVRDLQVNGSANQRIDSWEAQGFTAERGNNVELRWVKVYNVGGTGIMFRGHQFGSVWDSELIETWADGIHVTGDSAGPSFSVALHRNYAWATRDDGFACVGYQGTVNQYVGFYDNTTHYAGNSPTFGSGITVEGCEFVEVHRNYISRSADAGIRVASEAYWPTSRVNEVDVRWNTLVEVRQNQSYDHPAILVYTNSSDVANVHIRDNTIQNPATWMAFWLYGSGGPSVHDSQVENNQVTDAAGRITSDNCVNVGSGTYNLSIAGNTLNGGICQ